MARENSSTLISRAPLINIYQQSRSRIVISLSTISRLSRRTARLTGALCRRSIGSRSCLRGSYTKIACLPGNSNKGLALPSVIFVGTGNAATSMRRFDWSRGDGAIFPGLTGRRLTIATVSQRYDELRKLTMYYSLSRVWSNGHGCDARLPDGLISSRQDVKDAAARIPQSFTGWSASEALKHARGSSWAKQLPKTQDDTIRKLSV